MQFVSILFCLKVLVIHCIYISTRNHECTFCVKIFMQKKYLHLFVCFCSKVLAVLGEISDNTALEELPLSDIKY